MTPEPVLVERTSSDLERCGVRELFRLVNDARAAEGLEPLAEHPAISEVAQAWARELNSSLELEHSPYWMEELRPHARPRGENAAYSWTVTRMFNGWMNSPGHRGNIMSNANVAGFGLASGTAGIWGVQNFAIWDPEEHPPIPEWSEEPECPVTLDLLLQDDAGSAIADRSLRVLDGDDAEGWETDATHAWLGARTTDAEGNLRLHLALPAEGTRTARVLVHDDDWKVLRRLHLEVTADGDIVPPSALEPLGDRYVLPVTGPNLPVRVVDGRGEPVGDAWVDVRPWEEEGYAPGSDGWSTSSDSDGRAVVHAIVPAERAQRFRVSASAPDLPTAHHIVEVDADGTVDHGDVDLLADGTLELTLTPNLPLRLIDRDEAPLPGIRVQLDEQQPDGTWTPASGPLQQGVTNAGGRVDLHADAPDSGTTQFRLNLPADLTTDPISLTLDYRFTVDANGELSAPGDDAPDGQRLLALVRPTHPAFADLLFDDTHAAAIYRVAVEGISRGCGSATYCPRDTVTRAQMASFLTRALDLEPTPPPFDDARDDVHATAIGAVTAAGIAGGYPDGTYQPARPVTRAQMASFLTRALNLEPTPPPFDDARDDVHATAIGAVTAAGIAGGYTDGTYQPARPVTRAQMASFLTRALNLEPADAALDGE